MGKVVISGDEHIRSEEPFWSAKRDYFKWFANQDFNNKNNVLINTGDFFHNRNPSPRDYRLAYEFLNSLKFKEIYILAGNGVHEFNGSKQTYAIEPLGQYDNVTIVTVPMYPDIGNLKFCLLPALPPWRLRGQSMKDYYEQSDDEIDTVISSQFDYIIGHFFHKDGFGDTIDISALSGKRRMGHYHIPTKDGEYVGVNTITRNDEAGITPYLNVIDVETKEENYILVPKFIDYYTIDYKETDYLLDTEAHYPIFNVVNAPDEKSIYQKYGEIYINTWEKEKVIDDKGSTNDSDSKENNNQSLLEYFNAYVKSKTMGRKMKAKLKELVANKED